MKHLLHTINTCKAQINVELNFIPVVNVYRVGSIEGELEEYPTEWDTEQLPHGKNHRAVALSKSNSEYQSVVKKFESSVGKEVNILEV